MNNITAEGIREEQLPVMTEEPEAALAVPEDEEKNRSFWKDNRGVGVVEMILILVVLIALVLIFKTQLNSLVKTIFKTITKNAKSVLK